MARAQRKSVINMRNIKIYDTSDGYDTYDR